MNRVILFCIVIIPAYFLRIHNFYTLETVDLVSKSNSLMRMNECKEECLKMGQFFPFKFKYHRYILRETVGKNKYFQGTCQFAIEGDSLWHTWSQLQIFVTSTTLMPDMSEVQRWFDYNQKCEDTTLKLSNLTLESLNFKRVHSNFEYYDNGTFVNLQPFTDVGSMMNDLQGYIRP